MMRVRRRLWRGYIWLRRLPRRLAAVPESPHDIAKAFAVGVFIGILPGTGTVVALLAAFTFHLSKVATVLGSLCANPWTMPLIYAACYNLGKWILQLEEPIEWKILFQLRTGWPEQLGKAAPPMIVGGVVLGLLMAIIAYVVVRGVVAEYKLVRLHRAAERQRRAAHQLSGNSSRSESHPESR